MEKLLNILNELKPDIDFKNADGLVDNGILDSFDMVTLVMSLNEAYNTDIGVLDITPENFNSAASILSLVESLTQP